MLDGSDIAAHRPMSVRRAADLLNQQMWCWGCDVERADGNVLVEYGFQRYEKPAGTDAASVYRLDLSATSRVVLRGFGVFYGDDRWGGLFLRRFEFAPLLAPESELPQLPWSVYDLPPLASPRDGQFSRCRSLLLRLLDWIRGYESWIVSRFGVDYRADTLRRWKVKHGKTVPAEQTPFAWRILGLAVADDSTSYVPCR